MRFGNLHATRVKNGWEFRMYSGDRYFTTFLSEEDAHRVSEFIQEVNRYRKEWSIMLEKANDDGTVFISREELLDPSTANVVNVRIHKDGQDVLLDGKKPAECICGYDAPPHALCPLHGI